MKPPSELLGGSPRLGVAAGLGVLVASAEGEVYGGDAEAWQPAWDKLERQGVTTWDLAAIQLGLPTSVLERLDWGMVTDMAVERALKRE